MATAVAQSTFARLPRPSSGTISRRLAGAGLHRRLHPASPSSTHVHGAHVGARCVPERDHASGESGRVAHHPRVVGVGDEQRVGVGAFQDLGLRRRRCASADAEVADVRIADVGPHPHVRLGDPDEHANFARVVHAELHHRHVRAVPQLQQRQRQPEVVVQVPGVLHHRERAFEQRRHRLLRGRLPGAAGNRHHPCAPTARRTARPSSCSAAVVSATCTTAAGASAGRSNRGWPRRRDAPCPRRRARTRARRARRRWRRTPGRARSSASRSRTRVGSTSESPAITRPFMAVAMRAAVRTVRVAAPPTPPSSLRPASRQGCSCHGDVVERQHAIANLLVLLVPLAGDQHEIAGARLRHRRGRWPRRDRRWTRTSTVRARRATAGVMPRRISSMIRAGSSLRGLSEVTITTSLSRAATMPINGRLVRIAIATAAEDRNQPALRQRARGLEQVPQRVVGVRVVDDDGHVVAGARDDLEAARHAGQGVHAASHGSSGMSRATAVAALPRGCCRRSAGRPATSGRPRFPSACSTSRVRPPISSANGSWRDVGGLRDAVGDGARARRRAARGARGSSALTTPAALGVEHLEQPPLGREVRAPCPRGSRDDPGSGS